MLHADEPPILQRENLVSIARLLGALLFAGLATASLRGQRTPWDSAIFQVAALGLFLWELLRRRGLEAMGGPLVEEEPLGRGAWIALGLALLAGGVAWAACADNHLSRVALIALAASLIAVSAAARPLRRPAAEPAGHDLFPRRERRWALLGIVVLAAIFRLYLLDSLPGDMFNDLAYNYQETQRILNGEWMVYATGFPGREPLLFYLTALLSRLSGLNFYTLKLITALIGIGTVPVVYLLGREAYNDAVGLVAALFLAVAKWHVLISRVGFRGILTPLFVALVACFLLRALRRGRRGDFLWAGLFAGLSLYSYTAALAILPAVVLGLGLYAVAGHAAELWRARRSLLLAALVALLVAAPLLRFMLVEGRELYWFRTLTRVSEQETAIPGPVGQVLWENIRRTAGMFHVQGDSIFRTNVPYDAHLDVVAGALFLLGFPLVVARWRRGGNTLVVAFFLVMLLPTTLALAFPQEVPGAVRSGGALATVMLFPAVALVAMVQRLGEALPALRSRWAWGGLLAAVALASGAVNAHLCFVAYPQSLPEQNYPLYREIAGAIDEFGADGAVLLKTIPYWDDKDAIRVQTQWHKEFGLHGEIIDRLEKATFEALDAAQVAVIVNPEEDATSLRGLEVLYPEGITLYYRDPRGNPQFAVYLFKP